MKVGLRFTRSDCVLLDDLCERARRREIPEAAALLNAAAGAARAGEPMILECADTEEARKVAQGFIRWGVIPPTIEAVSQDA